MRIKTSIVKEITIKFLIFDELQVSELLYSLATQDLVDRLVISWKSENVWRIYSNSIMVIKPKGILTFDQIEFLIFFKGVIRALEPGFSQNPQAVAVKRINL